MSFDFGDHLTDAGEPVVLEEEHYDGKCRIKELILKVSGGEKLRVFFEICKCRRCLPNRSLEIQRRLETRSVTRTSQVTAWNKDTRTVL